MFRRQAKPRGGVAKLLSDGEGVFVTKRLPAATKRALGRASPVLAILPPMRQSPRFESAPATPPAPAEKRVVEERLPRETLEAAAKRLEDYGVVAMLESGHSNKFVAQLINEGQTGRELRKRLKPARKFLGKSGEKRSIAKMRELLPRMVRLEAARVEHLAQGHEGTEKLIQAARRFRSFDASSDSAHNAHQYDLSAAQELEEQLALIKPAPWSSVEWEAAYTDIKRAVETVHGAIASQAELHRHTAGDLEFLKNLREEQAALRSQRASLANLKHFLKEVPRKERLPMREYAAMIQDSHLPIPQALLGELEKGFEWEFGKEKAFTMLGARTSLLRVEGDKTKVRDTETRRTRRYDYEPVKVPNERYEIRHGRRKGLVKRIDQLLANYDAMIDDYGGAIHEAEGEFERA